MLQRRASMLAPSTLKTGSMTVRSWALPSTTWAGPWSSIERIPFALFGHNFQRIPVQSWV